MGGGSKKGTSSVVTQPSPAEIAPEFKPYAQAVGQGALGHLQNFNLADFAGDMTLQVPGLNDMQRSALERIQQRFDQGIPTPASEQQAKQLFPYALNTSQSQIGIQPNEQFGLDIATALPAYAGQQVESDPLRMFQYGQAQNTADRVGARTDLNPLRLLQYLSAGQTADEVGQNVGMQGLETYGTDVLKSFAGGETGQSPVIQAAVEQLNNVVNPMLENKATKAGLGRSGEMLRELQEGSIGYMLPLFMQGVQQQQAAANTLVGAGAEQARRLENTYGRQMSMENLLSNFANQIGTADEGLQESAKQRDMQMENLLSNFANQIGASREGLATDAVTRGTAAMADAAKGYFDVGGREAERKADTVNRMLQTSQGMYDALLQLGEREAGRDTQALNEMIQGGALDRDIAGQMAEAAHADDLRRQALSEVFHTAMLGQIPSFTTFPSTTTETTKTPSSK